MSENQAFRIMGTHYTVSGNCIALRGKVEVSMTGQETSGLPFKIKAW